MITLRDILTGSAGTLRGEAELDTLFNRVWHDSRQIEPGDVFVAVQGEQQDGHAFVAQAFDRGAGAAIVAKDRLAALADVAGPLIVVDDTIAGLQRLAAYWRSLYNVKVIGITGSIGKSSTKEVVASVLSGRFNTVRSRGSFNNELGLPLSLLEISPDTEAVVLEMGGAYQFGEIEQLCEIARPSIGVVTNVSHSHLSRMGSLEAIAQTKVELPASLPEDGVAILNGDDERVRAMASQCRCRTVFYGLAADCDVRAADVVSNGLEGISFRLSLHGKEHHLKVPLMGRHSAHTALAAIAVGDALGLAIDDMLPGFLNPGIQFRLLTVPGTAGSTIIDDTYNANPASSLAALNLLEELQASRRIAVLADMMELGQYEEEGHKIVGRRAAAVVDLLFTLGERARMIAAEAVEVGFPEDAVWVLDDKQALIEVLKTTLRSGDVVLVKGSRSIRMEEVVEQLRDRTQAE